MRRHDGRRCRSTGSNASANARASPVGIQSPRAPEGSGCQSNSEQAFICQECHEVWLEAEGAQSFALSLTSRGVATKTKCVEYVAYLGNPFANPMRRAS